MNKKQPTLKVKFENVPSYTITGFFGGLNPNEGSISFFQDQLVPQEGENPGEIVLDYIEQNFILNIRMNPVVFKRLAFWMNGNFMCIPGLVMASPMGSPN